MATCFFVGLLLGIVGIIIAAVATPPARAAAFPPGWYADRWRQAPYRYWSGAAWTPYLSGDPVAPV